jgi:hypothetical protein
MKSEKLPIDRPCSACGDGDTEMEYHDHHPPFRARTLRETLMELMVNVNQISPELADYHVARMTDAEVREEFELRGGSIRVSPVPQLS